MKRRFESIPTLSKIFIPYYNINNKQFSFNYGKYNNISNNYNNSNNLGFMCNVRFKQYCNKNDNSTHSWVNMIGNINNNRFKLYESCYFQDNPLNDVIQLDYSLLWFDVITNEPFYSPVSQEINTKMRDKISINLNLKQPQEVIPDNFWVLLSNTTQNKLNIIQDILKQNNVLFQYTK